MGYNGKRYLHSHQCDVITCYFVAAVQHDM